ncbi:uncharacterized protein TrAtP1_009116 [Trichoderma atroviride]|uniref:uncharacterized protein n=1 Tax=Hypocrea atroviridis TaxID=63577 RepID=UPI003318B555|nr:hypothetical protein TrAtP1_009116 [Trichoderma atroviride]
MMHSVLLPFSLCCLAMSSSAKAIIPATGCGNPPPSEGEIARAQAMYAKERTTTLDVRSTDLVTIPTWFHVVYVNETEEGGYIPRNQLDAQITVLNDAWEPHGFSFNLVNATYTQNATWSNSNLDGWPDMKRALRQGGYGTLNLYTTLLTEGSGLLGIGTPPGDYYDGSDDFLQDGVVIQANTLPGGIGPHFETDPERYTTGRLACHEVGHWFGLFHTYIEHGTYPYTCQNGDNDFVDDTPVHLLVLTSNGPDLDCPAGRDTCPDLPGVDPTDNYMSNQWQSCWTEFTAGQGLRSRSLWTAQRAGRG